MKKTALLFVLAVGTMFPLFGQQGNIDIGQFFPIDNGHSYVGFQIKYMGYANLRGRFAKFNGTVRFNEKDVRQTSVSISIDAASIDSESEWRDKDLVSENWFNAAAFPSITFVSHKTEPTATGIQVTGDLTIHGITKMVTIPMDKPIGIVKNVNSDPQVIFNGELTIDRKDFGVEGKNWEGVKEGITAVADNVRIELTILAKQISESNFRNWVSDANSPQGKLYQLTKTSGAESALKEFDAMRSAPGSKVTAGALNSAGFMLLKENKVDDALKLFKKNIEVFPEMGTL